LTQIKSAKILIATGSHNSCRGLSLVALDVLVDVTDEDIGAHETDGACKEE
jgi:hypothetical protein